MSSGWLCHGARAVAATGLSAAVGRPVEPIVRIASEGAGRAGGRSDARARSTIPPLWLSAHPGVSGPPRLRDERRPSLSALAPGRAAGAAQTTATADCQWAAAADAAEGSQSCWAYDFVYDRCANGQQLKCLTVVDEWTRECLAIEVSGSIRSRHVIDVLARLISVHGAPRYLRSDNGPEFVSRAILRWLSSSNIDTALIDPGKPWQNATNESFNDKFRDECLSLEWFRSRAEAKVLIEIWRKHYNEVRPHSSLGYLTPREFINSGAVLQ